MWLSAQNQWQFCIAWTDENIHHWTFIGEMMLKQGKHVVEKVLTQGVISPVMFRSGQLVCWHVCTFYQLYL